MSENPVDVLVKYLDNAYDLDPERVARARAYYAKMVDARVKGTLFGELNTMKFPMPNRNLKTFPVNPSNLSKCGLLRLDQP